MSHKFSQRIGLTSREPIVQIEDMSLALRNSLWNVLYQRVEASNEQRWKPFARLVASDFLKVPSDEIPMYFYQCRDWVKDAFFRLTWYQVYDFVEFVVHEAYSMFLADKGPLIVHLNQVLEREGSGYRFIAGILSPISNPSELAAVSEAYATTARVGLSGANEHLSTALALLSKRPDPDYRNSIKESISSIESIVKSISGETSGGLAGALDAVSAKIPIHGALRSALKSLYGYTSDDSGIRHAILEAPNVGFDEAKFMLVSCSAFANFLIAKAEQAGLLRS
ncbi:MAG: AbiJ-NTD4 domain-containing protein [Gemmatimonadota bacterium]